MKRRKSESGCVSGEDHRRTEAFRSGFTDLDLLVVVVEGVQQLAGLASRLLDAPFD